MSHETRDCSSSSQEPGARSHCQKLNAPKLGTINSCHEVIVLPLNKRSCVKLRCWDQILDSPSRVAVFCSPPTEHAINLLKCVQLRLKRRSCGGWQWANLPSPTEAHPKRRLQGTDCFLDDHPTNQPTCSNHPSSECSG